MFLVTIVFDYCKWSRSFEFIHMKHDAARVERHLQTQPHQMTNYSNERKQLDD